MRTRYLVCLAMVSMLPLCASTVYTYTGNSPSGFTITLDLPSAIGLSPGTDVSADLTSFLTPGYPPIEDDAAFPLADPSTSSIVAQIGTDSLGNITSWNISESIFGSYPAFSGENPLDFFCTYSASSTSASGDQVTLTDDNDAGFCP